MEEEIKVTSIWTLYERGVNYNRIRNIYSDTDTNFRMYNGDQLQGLETGIIEKVQLNIIKPIVKYKVGTICSNLWAINYSNNNFSSPEFQQKANRVCELLNKRASLIWEKDNMDLKIRQIAKQSAINSESIIYVDYKDGMPKNEILSKTDVYYGNENSEDIQLQPYIIIKSRKPLDQVRKLAKENQLSEEKINQILADQETTEESGENSKYEVNDMCILLTKLWKENGTVHFSQATRNVDIIEDKDTELTLYPIMHFIWESVEGSARGEGEVKYIIPNQMEINKTMMRRALVVTQCAYPKPVINVDMVENPDDVTKIGVELRVTGREIDDVRKIFNYTTPAQISGDSKELMESLISITRELNGAGDIATGDVNPESASGRAILAVQKASQQPLTEQTIGLKTAIEDLARIWQDMDIVYNPKGLEVTTEKIIKTQINGTENIDSIETIPQQVLQEIKASIRVDITPTGSFDKYAVELSLENLFMNGKITFEEYVKALPNESVMPKSILEDIIKDRQKAQQEIATAEIEANRLNQKYNQIMNTADELIELEQPIGQPMEQMV